MIWLSKHYEKLILSIFLIIFVVSLVWLIFVFQAAKKIKDQDVIYTPPDRPEFKYKPINVNDFRILDTNLAVDSQLSKLWHESSKRVNSSVAFTDFTIPIIAIRSPVSGRTFPQAFFEFKETKEGLEVGKCPDKEYDKFIGVEWKKEKEVITLDNKKVDSDNDGIPDEVERKLGMDPNDPNDIYYDLDGDGFSNLVEYKAGTELNNPKSHPPLIERCSLLNIERKKLPIKIIVVQENGTIQAEITEKNKRRTKWIKVGDELDIAGDVYKISEFKYKTIQKNDARIKDIVEVNDSEVTLVPKIGSPILAKIKADIYENREKIIIKDLFTELQYVTYKNANLIIGDEKTGKEEYKVINFDNSNKTVKLQDQNNKIYTIKAGQTDYRKPQKIGSTPLGSEKPF